MKSPEEEVADDEWMLLAVIGDDMIFMRSSLRKFIRLAQRACVLAKGVGDWARPYPQTISILALTFFFTRWQYLFLSVQPKTCYSWSKVIVP